MYRPLLHRRILPQELVDSIVWEVAKYQDATERRSALNACSLTSWSFRAPSRRILFQEVSLREDSGEDESFQNQLRSRLQKFLDLLQHNTSLEMDVLSLHIFLSTLRLSRNRVETFRGQNAERAILPSILNSLSHVRSLFLTVDCHTINHDWDYVDVLLKGALLRLCSLTPMTHLKLGSVMGFPMSFIAPCSQITSLSVYGAVSTKCAPDPQPTLQTLPRLKSLTIIDKNSSTILFPHDPDKCRCPSTHFDLSTLQRLDLYAEILQESSLNIPSVTHLSLRGSHRNLFNIGINERSEPIENAISFNTWRNLQVLELNWSIAVPNQDVGLGVLPLINPERPGNSASASETQRISIHTLVLNIRWSFCNGTNELQHFTPAAGWNTVDAMLTSPRFPNLRTIKLVFLLEHTQTTATPANLMELSTHLRNRLQSYLPRLLPIISAENLIKVEVQVVGVKIMAVNRFMHPE